MTEDDAREARAIAGVALQVIAEISRDQLEPGATGERPCPKCGGVIAWSIGPRRRGYRRRQPNVIGACRTPGCDVSFRS